MRIELLFLTYNRLGVTIRCLKSMAHTLSDPRVTWRIWDNSSSDGTPEWLMKLQARYPEKVNVYLSAQNLGVAGGRTELLRLSKGNIIGFLDSDVDALEPTWLDSVVDYLEYHKEAGLVGKAGHQLLPDWKIMAYPEDFEGPVDVLSGYCQFFRRKDIEKHRIRLDMSFNYGGAEDDDWCAQFLHKGFQIHQLNLPLHHQFSGTWNIGVASYTENRKRLQQKWGDKAVFSFQKQSQAFKILSAAINTQSK